MTVITNVNIDLATLGAKSQVNAMQNDKNCRKIAINLFARGVAWVIPEGSTAMVRYRKADGTGGLYDTLPDGSTAYSVQDNVITITLAPQVCTAAGPVSLSVGLAKNEAEILTFPIRIQVQADPGENIASDNYVNIGGIQRVYDLDLREVTDFDIFGGVKSQSFDITDHVNADELFATAAAGKVIRLRTKDSAMGSDICVLLTDYTDFSDGSGTARAVQGSYWYNTVPSDLSHFQILQWGGSVRLRWTDTKIPTNVLSSTGWDPNKYLGTDADGNVVAVDAPEGGGGGTVKTVNGVAPDESGNVTIETGGTVKTVNGVKPDENGNVEISIPESGGGNDGSAAEWDAIENKPFGDVLETIDVTYDTASDVIDSLGLVKVAECPNIYELGLARMPYADMEEGIVDSSRELVAYPQIIDAAAIDEVNSTGAFPADASKYGCVLVDFVYLQGGEPGLLYEFLQVSSSGGIEAQLPIFASPNGGSFNGVTFPAGIFFMDSTELPELYLEYDIYSKIPRKLLPDNIASSGGNSDDVVDVIAGNVHIYNIGAGTFDPTTFDMSGYAVNDIVFVVGDIATGDEAST